MYLDNPGGTNNSRMTQWTKENPDVWEYKVIKNPAFRTAYTHGSQFNRGMMVDWYLASGPDDKVAEFENNLQKQNFLPSQDPALKMKSYANRLKRLNASKILVHKRWTQLVPERTNPQPIYIQAGKFLKNSYELEGTISLSARRFLHFEANLIYQDPKQRPDLNAIVPPTTDLSIEIPIT